MTRSSGPHVVEKSPERNAKKSRIDQVPACSGVSKPPGLNQSKRLAIEGNEAEFGRTINEGAGPRRCCSADRRPPGSGPSVRPSCSCEKTSARIQQRSKRRASVPRWTIQTGFVRSAFHRQIVVSRAEAQCGPTLTGKSHWRSTPGIGESNLEGLVPL